MAVIIGGKRIKSLPEQVNDNTKLLKEHDTEIKVIEGAIFPDMPDVPDLIDIPDRVDDLESDVQDLKDEDIIIKGRLDTLEGIHRYRHSLWLTDNSNYDVMIDLFTNSPTPITTAAEILTIIGNNYIPATGWSSTLSQAALGMSNNEIYFGDQIGGNTYSTSTIVDSDITDRVQQLF